MTLQHYASTGIGRSLRQVMHALRSDDATIAEYVATRAQRLQRDQERMARALGRRVDDSDILIVGPGPYMVEPRFFGRNNKVTAVDLDVLPSGWGPGPYLQMWRMNGFGRFAKTVGRKILGVDRRHARAWQRELKVARLEDPILIQGDILQGPPREHAFDIAACWSVFQHLAEPAVAIRHMKAALRPGGVLYFGIHLFTSNTGHHDIRAFTGAAGGLPPWAHLRASTAGQVNSSAWLNKLRLRDWRALLHEHAPAYEEYRETYDDEARTLLTPGIRSELAGYDDEELLTVDVFFLWRKPIV